MRIKKIAILILIVFLSKFSFSTLYYETMFLKSTDFQFPVVRIEAEKDKSPVILIFGGIHGNEPGAYLTAEKLTDIKLDKGSIIVVPRVNFYSIMKNVRGFFGDMNRKFTKEEEKKKGDPDSRIVRILKKLMANADVFINLHDAWGFHRRYHKNFGQCIIVDGEKVFSKRMNKIINMEKIGKSIVFEVNKKIDNKAHLFAFWNQKTYLKHKEIRLKEMRYTATYFAYKKYNIPAFGIETSKNIKSDELKVHYHLMILKELFKKFGVKMKNEISSKIEKPEFGYLTLNIDNKIRILPNEETLYENPSTKFFIMDIMGNRKFGWAADIIGWGGNNDKYKNYFLKSPTKIIIKHDFKKIGEVNILPSRTKPYILVKINKTDKKIYAGEKIILRDGDKLQLIKAVYKNYNLDIDFKGYASKTKINRGDDRGNIIIYKELKKKYSLNKKGKLYKIEARKNKIPLFFILIKYE